jgi:hypothetical protein
MSNYLNLMHVHFRPVAFTGPGGGYNKGNVNIIRSLCKEQQWWWFSTSRIKTCRIAPGVVYIFRYVADELNVALDRVCGHSAVAKHAYVRLDSEATEALTILLHRCPRSPHQTRPPPLCTIRLRALATPWPDAPSSSSLWSLSSSDMPDCRLSLACPTVS